VLGSVNYIIHGNGGGVLVCLLGIIALGLGLCRMRRWTFFPALLAGGILVHDFVNASFTLARETDEMSRNLAGNPFRGLAELAFASIQWEIGLPAMAAGIVLVLVAALIPSRGLNPP
jgi:hypothetical protein